MSFFNPLVILQLISSLISAFTADITSFIILISMVALNVTLDFIQEYRAKLAAEDLRHSIAFKTLAIRDKKIIKINIEKLLLGDEVLLRAGNLVSADTRIIEVHDFFDNQALLTGESYPVKKEAADLQQTEAYFWSASNAMFAGISVISCWSALPVKKDSWRHCRHFEYCTAGNCIWTWRTAV